MNAKTKEHPADGIYYVDYRMLKGKRACHRQYKRWLSFFGVKDIPITLSVLRKMQTLGDECVHWAARCMFYSSQITGNEFRAFDRAYFTGHEGVCNECTAFMDLLAARARREGRLP